MLSKLVIVVFVFMCNIVSMNTEDSLKVIIWNVSSPDDHVVRCTSYIPVLFQRIPIVPVTVLHPSIIACIDDSSVFQVKLSSQGRQFTNYHGNSMWVSQFSIPCSYLWVKLQDYLLCAGSYHPHYAGLNFLKSHEPTNKTVDCAALPNSVGGISQNDGDTDKSHSNTEQIFGNVYVYGHLPLKRDISPLSLGLSRLLTALGAQNSVHLTLIMGTAGVVATMHYDEYEVFLLQIRGTKTLTLASPDALEVVEPHSSLHPHFRQSQHLELTSAAALYAAIQAHRDAGGLREGLNPRVWQVQLNPGDLLYIPPGFFHSVTTGDDSMTISAFVPSNATSLARQLIDRFPHSAQQTKQLQLATLGVVLRNLISLLEMDLPAFRQAMARGFRNLVKDPVFQCSLDLEVCGTIDLLDAEARIENIATALDMHAMVDVLPAALPRMALLVYVAEQLVERVLELESSPCLALLFVEQCLLDAPDHS